MSVKIQDDNSMDTLLNALEDLGRHRLEIGIFGDQDTELIMIAAVHEFGVEIDVTPKMRAFLHTIDIHLKKDTKTINIPERSYMRAGFDNNVRKIERTAEELLGQVIDLQIDARAFYEALGGVCVSVFQEYLTNLRDPALADVTINQKGSSNPLIDTQRLRNAITWRVVSA